jgi:hypothetical protein
MTIATLNPTPPTKAWQITEAAVVKHLLLGYGTDLHPDKYLFSFRTREDAETAIPRMLRALKCPVETQVSLAENDSLREIPEDREQLLQMTERFLANREP